MNEIIFIGNKLQILKPALIWSASNLRYLIALLSLDFAGTCTFSMMEVRSPRALFKGSIIEQDYTQRLLAVAL